ncbi:MAG: T9SS type A sorting domain-containing protein, partial [Rhodothermales bacterium]|nr:T9SS type A sorting domain-containing protein [Rhodothermales bacterium]
DTLRNYQRSNTVFRIPSSTLFPSSTGWIHGTNSFEDRAKATRLALPSNAENATVEEILVTFIHKGNNVTTEEYAVEIFDVDPLTGGPGTLLGGQIFSYAFVDADEDLGTPAVTTIHVLDNPIPVSDDFFLVVDFGTYGSAVYESIAIASTDFLGRFVAEDWEQLASGGWINMSTSWLSDADDGWLMWLDAVVRYDAQSNNPPTITHTPITSATAGEDLTISATISATGGTSLALVAYAQGSNSATPPLLTMSNTGGNVWQATIPGTDVNLRGLRYAIGAADGNGVTANTADFNVRVSDDEGLSQPISVTGSTESAYRLVSIPVVANNTTPAAVLQDDLGNYDPSSWRLFGLNADQSYGEFPNSGAMAPGAAFWLASSEAGREITTGPATSVSLAGEYAIPLNPGWTFVGTPFNFPVSRPQLRLASGGTVDIRTFTGSWSAFTGSMQPFVGYAVASVASDQLLVAPFTADVLARFDGEPAPARALPTAKTEAEVDWQIHIQARSTHAQDTDNYAALSASSSPRWDALDRPEPPVIGAYVSLYFGRQDWDVPFRRFSTDARPFGAGQVEWTFELSTSVDEPIQLTFDGLESVPEDLEIWLLDRLLHTHINIRRQPAYTVAGSPEAFADRFSLLVGEPDVLAATLAGARELPESMTIESFPNPFRTSTSIRFGLPADDVVTLKVYDLLGKEVATLLSRSAAERGFHSIIWDGQNQAELPVRSGMYLYVLESQTTRVTGRTVVLR